MPAIRRLPEGTVNRIAAGEVIERPASVVKELVENALDAGAGFIEVACEGGGIASIIVTDDGGGIPAGELPLAVLRHATSKLGDERLVQIPTLGFRGEALPSIGAIARLRLVSRPPGAATAHRLTVEGGVVGEVAPAAGPPGTRVEVQDLFWRTPARLKFLRSERAENEAITETVRRLALAHPAVGWALRLDGRDAFLARAVPGEADPFAARLGVILGPAVAAAAIRLDATRDTMALFGLAGLPTQARGDARHQYLVVNGRPVQDRLLKAALRAAYSDLLHGDRQPVAALFLDLPFDLLDVNVHPTKAEVRFAEPAAVRNLLVGAVRQALAAAGHRAAAPTAAFFAGRGGSASVAALPLRAAGQPTGSGLAEDGPGWAGPGSGDGAAGAMPALGDLPPLGRARAQLHDAYILAETEGGLVLIDQHAAHERLVYEDLKAEVDRAGVRRQVLLLPEIVALTPSEVRCLAERATELVELGLVLEPFGTAAVVVRETPARLGSGAVAALVQDVATDLVELGGGVRLREALDRVLGTMACHGSVRAGRKLSLPEMDALLRQMETKAFTGQCIHGRPTYIELGLDQIDRMFARR